MDGLISVVQRRWRTCLIALFVVVQLLLPLHYYVARRDPHDERFAWRMFSPMRMAQCKANLEVDGKKVELAALYHEAWIELGKRGRYVVLEKMAAQQCAQKPGAVVTLELECRYLGTQEPEVHGGFNLCEIPEL
jgi:hypothetical protein